MSNEVVYPIKIELRSDSRIRVWQCVGHNLEGLPGWAVFETKSGYDEWIPHRVIESVTIPRHIGEGMQWSETDEGVEL
jgi:hypothetical protein